MGDPAGFPDLLERAGLKGFVSAPTPHDGSKLLFKELPRGAILHYSPDFGTIDVKGAPERRDPVRKALEAAIAGSSFSPSSESVKPEPAPSPARPGGVVRAPSIEQAAELAKVYEQLDQAAANSETLEAEAPYLANRLLLQGLEILLR